ncbi:tocopherol cyclase family protein [Pseudobutyrivibrio ruminis]|uniref:Tocopherol cyclase n=1 Tax=Pseudobutyrivibrio ruminis DSM 9787 TaxID=1123011 RepID=A0A285RX03_9FIRM|nr:tocopherol cyclase family protein [Pseudobutyrivibrio ruminis]SOB98937.1 Tocopherol cyclase [Pseudobutyrivibrio ruminis DSM 9787]
MVKEKISQLGETVLEKIDGLDVKDKLLEGSFNHSDILRNNFMLKGALASEGYDWWWHSFTGHNKKTGEEKAFFIEFFTINPELGGDEPVFGQLPENKAAGKKPSYMMVKAGCWGEGAKQLHRFFSWNQVNIKEEAPFLISADNCFCSETRTLGMVEVTEEDAANHPEWMCQSGKMIWDLNIEKDIAFNVGYGASWASRELEAFEMFWHAEGMKTFFNGSVILDGEEYVVDKDSCYGYADKNWGKDFTSPWVWLASSHLKSKLTGKWLDNTAFDIGGGRPKIRTGKTFENVILGAVWYEGEPYEFNFSKFWTLTKTDFACNTDGDEVVWNITQETPLAKIEGHFTCQKKDMLLINYEAPNGEKRHNNLWNGGNGVGELKLYKKILKTKDNEDGSMAKFDWELVDDMEAYNIGCEFGEYDK